MMGYTFQAWLQRVDKVLMLRHGVTHRDLADWHWRDAFDSQWHHADAATEALEANGYGSLYR